MACLASLGRKEPCKDSLGGLYKIWFCNYGADFTVSGSDEVTDVQTDGGASTFYEYELKGASDLTQNVMSSRDNGTTYWEQVLTLQFKKLTKEDNKELKILAYGRPHIFVGDNNGNVFAVGLQDGAEVTGGTIVTGQAKGDLSGYTLTFTAQEAKPANFLSGSTLSSPFGALSTTPTVVSGSNS